MLDLHVDDLPVIIFTVSIQNTLCQCTNLHLLAFPDASHLFCVRPTIAIHDGHSERILTNNLIN